MPIRFSELGGKVRHVRVKWEDLEVNISYSPSANTAATSIAMQEELEGETAGQTKAIVDGLQRILVGWDILEDTNGKDKPDTPVPISEDFLMRLPLSFLVAILTAIGEDQNPTPPRSRR
jgi:hypothetical protein